ncbi:MAG: response regulator transcription factor [Chloroflexota bacterium]
MKRKWRALVAGERVAWSAAAIAALQEAGFDVDSGRDWADAITSSAKDQPDALVLLVEGVNEGLLDACRVTSVGSPVAVVMLGPMEDETYVVDSLDAGADDFIPWPARPELLGARLRAVLRRGDRSRTHYTPIKIRDLTIDLLSHEVTMGDRRVELTPTEFRLLACLVRNAGQVIPSRALLREAQGYDCEEQEAQDIIKVHIRRLRNKLEPDPNNPTYIINIRRFGYMLERRAIERRAATAKLA